MATGDLFLIWSYRSGEPTWHVDSGTTLSGKCEAVAYRDHCRDEYPEVDFEIVELLT